MAETAHRRILLTGVQGQVGWELWRTLQPLGEIVATDLAPPSNARFRALNLADPAAIRALVREVRPQLIVNPAAYTAVDQAEDDVELATAINGTAPGVFAEEAQRCGAALVHYSTDYVFDGTKAGPYTEDDATNPMNVYGRTKLAGEQAIRAVGVPHLIFRTSWVYGARGKNFLLTILRLARERPELKIVNDQIGAPNWSRLLAELTAQALATQLATGDGPLQERLRKVSGVYNLSAAGETSWHGFAARIVELYNALLPLPSGQIHHERKLACNISGIPTSAYPTRAIRPANSRLSTDKLTSTFGLVPPDWEESLARCMEELRATPSQ